MSAWPGKYVIGLTGNIATGKSVVRRMLEHLGAYGIDADSLGHRAIARGAPGHQDVIEMFGRWVLGPEGEIDRAKLGRVVFSDPEALKNLEQIVHPLVRQAIDILVRRSRHNIIVIEAIKLLESGLADLCDVVWVTYAPKEKQFTRLKDKRKMTDTLARQRIRSQQPQEDKIKAADVVIRNDGTFEATWLQVVVAWERVFPSADADSTRASEPLEVVAGEVMVKRARPRDADLIARLVTRFSGNKLSAEHRRVDRDDIMAAFGEKAFLILYVDGNPMGVVGWQVENLVARTDEVYLDSSLDLADALSIIMAEVERASIELQCEISLLFLPDKFAGQEEVFHRLEYKLRMIKSLNVSAWEEAAQESMPPNSILLFKQLREDRVLRPV